MTVWIILFLIVLVISFILALISMRDFPQSSQDLKTKYSLYLIRQTRNLTAEYFDTLHKSLARTSFFVSFERLIKGRKSAICLFAPAEVADESPTLDLLELEDYTLDISDEQSSVWEVGLKTPKSGLKITDSLFKNFPQLQSSEQFFWQVIVKPKSGGFSCQIRAAVFSTDSKRRADLVKKLISLGGDLVKVPKPFSSSQLLNFYQNRTFLPHKLNPQLSNDEILRLIRLGF